MDNHYVYVWYRDDDGTPFYVGQGTGRRYKEKGFGKRNPYFMNVFNKHGGHSEIIYSEQSQEEALDLEAKTISDLRSKGYALTNLTDGGVGTPGRKVDDAYRLKYHYMCLGENNPNYGHKWNEEQRKRASEYAHSRNWFGEKSPNSKKIMRLEDGKIFGCLDDAMKEHGLTAQGSFTILKKEPWRTAGGKHWAFEDEFDILDTQEKRDKRIQYYTILNKRTSGRTGQ